MCGIVAILNTDPGRPVESSLVRRMTDTMTHRGPNDSGVWCQGPVGLGHRRLSILDLSEAGRGPMANTDKSLILTYNGEIYNYQEIRLLLEKKGHRFHSQTDTEVILNAYEEWGTECLTRFNGMFAFALWDRSRRYLFVARDRFGIKPLVYYTNASTFICASELKAILANPETPKNLDPVSLHHYLSLKVVPTPLTIYKDIFRLRPGHYLIVKNGRITEHQWWKLEFGPEIKSPKAAVIEELDSLLTDSVRLRLISDAPLGSFLSGGVDSSIISALSANLLNQEQLRTFSVSFLGQGQYDESPYARQVAGHINSKHSEIDLHTDFFSVLPEVVQLFDEPFAVSSALAVYLMARETVKHVRVILTGDGADEVFAGYPYRQSQLDERFNRIARLPLSGLRSLGSRWPQPPISWEQPNWLRYPHLLYVALSTPDSSLRLWRYLQSLYSLNEVEKFSLYTPEWAEYLRSSSDFSSTDEFLLKFFPKNAPSRLMKWLYFDVHTTLVDEMLAKVDKATMAWGLEARTPFLDYRLVEFVMRLPSAMMAQGAEGKFLLKQMGEKYVPQNILYRKKHGFEVPMSIWLRKRFPELFTRVLSTTQLKKTGIFQPETVHKIITRHQGDPHIDLSPQIFTLACFELWTEMSGS